MNNWNFTGNIGKDAATKTTPNGKTICDFSVAVSSGFGDNKKTTWVSCVLFGKRAESQLPQYLVKGQQVAVSGEATLEQWDKQDGSKGSAMRVAVNSVDLVGERKQQAAPQAPQQAAPSGGGLSDFDDDIPFAPFEHKSV